MKYGYIANKKNLKKFFPEKYKRLNKTINTKNQVFDKCYKNEYYYQGTFKNVIDRKLDIINAILEFYGIEAIRNEKEYISHYYQDIVLLYCNSGDAYTNTIAFDTKKEQFIVFNFGDCFERIPEKELNYFHQN